jgi:hypothetical protein
MSYYKKKQEEIIQSRKFTKTFSNDQGIISIWKYDLDKTTRGPVEVEQIYPKDYISPIDKNKKPSKSQQKYINPKNGKEISYYRAKALGLI